MKKGLIWRRRVPEPGHELGLFPGDFQALFNRAASQAPKLRTLRKPPREALALECECTLNIRKLGNDFGGDVSADGRISRTLDQGANIGVGKIHMSNTLVDSVARSNFAYLDMIYAGEQVFTKLRVAANGISIA